MRAKDPGLILKQSHDAMLEEVSGHVCVYRGKRIIKEVDFFILRQNKPWFAYQEDKDCLDQAWR